MLKDAYPFYVGADARASGATLDVTNKYSGEVVTRVAEAKRRDVEEAITKAVGAFEEYRRWEPYRRKAVLTHVVQRVQDRKDEFAYALAVETGKPIRFAVGEVERCIDTFTLSAEESVRNVGAHMSLAVSERGAGYESVSKRVPIGPCSFITPFNFPLNLLAHKVGPALAMGCTCVVKPDPRTPITSIMLAEILAETDLPDGAFSVLTVVEDGRELLVEDDRLKLLSFTGSTRVGWALRSQAGRKRVLLELGGDAAVILDESADVERAAERIAFGAYYQAGQSCISVQRILAHRSVYEKLKMELLPRIESLVNGDPLDENTFVGPLIEEKDAERVEQWVEEAVRAGAVILTGGTREGALYAPTLLENVPSNTCLAQQEVFGPVAYMQPFETIDEAFAEVNRSEFGLQAGIFTSDLETAWRAFDELEVGGVIINDVPSMRVDAMPYGGVKASGVGREGVRYAMDDMSEIRLMVLSRRRS